MKKILAILLCVLVILPCCLPFAAAKKEEKKEVEFTLDLNERYTDIVEVSEGDILYGVANNQKEDNTSKRTVYIAVLVTALVISVIILIVTLRRVPDEDEVDISGTGKIRKDEKTEDNEE